MNRLNEPFFLCLIRKMFFLFTGETCQQQGVG